MNDNTGLSPCDFPTGPVEPESQPHGGDHLVLGPEHAECVIANNLIRQELRDARSQVVELGQKVEQLERVGICGSRTQGLTLPNAASSDLVCTLLTDHRGWHQDDAGVKWSVRPESVDLPGDWKTQIWDTLMLGNENPGECQGDLVQLIESWRPKAADDQPVAARVWQKGDPEPPLRSEWIVGLANWLHENTDCDDPPTGAECCGSCWSFAERTARAYNRVTDGWLEVLEGGDSHG